MVRVAILSFWHVHAKDYAAEALAHPEVELVAVWDEDPARGRAEAAARGVAFHETLPELLAREDIDGVVVTTATSAHKQVIPAAARAGKHVFTEKVIAPTLAEAAAIVAETDRTGVAFVVSLPRLSLGAVQAIQAVLAEGGLGELTHLRVRVGHEGAVRTAKAPDGWLPRRFYDAAAAGGGALIDLGAHPLYLSRFFLGLPERVSASYGFVTGRAVEDQAVVALHYAGGALAVAEVSFVARSPLTIEANATAGNLRFGGAEPDLWLRSGTGNVGEWSKRAPLPPDGPSPFDQWIGQIQDGTRAPENVRLALDLSALAEAANRSAAEGRTVPISDVATGDGAG